MFHSFGFVAAHIHDINYLKDVKHNLKNCILIDDRGYVDTLYQLDLFIDSNINLSIPMRKNQHNYVPFSKAKSKIIKRLKLISSNYMGGFF